MTAEEWRAFAASAGFPWDRLADAEADLCAAQAFAALALEAGDAGDRHKAEYDLVLAIDRAAKVREELADVFLLMFEMALSAAPERIASQLIRFTLSMNWKADITRHMAAAGTDSFTAMLDSFRGMVLPFQRRLQSFERRQAAFEERQTALQRENWELAQELAKLRKENARVRQT